MLLQRTPSLIDEEQFRRAAVGGVQPNLNLGIIKSTVVPLPPSAEQSRIVATLDKLLSFEEDLISNTSNQLTRLARLRQSILKWAFEGKLVDQDPNDEPASALLARIKAAQQPAPPARRTQKKS